MSKRPLHVYALKRGGVYFWNRAAGTSKITMQHQPGEPGFHLEYQKLLAQLANGTIRKQRDHRVKHDKHIDTAEGSIGELSVAYFASDKYQRMARGSQQMRRRCVETCLQTMVESARNRKAAPLGEWKVDTLRHDDVETLRRNLPTRTRPTRLSDSDDGQHRDVHMTAMRAVFHWGISKSLCTFNPFARLEPLVNVEVRDGWYTWSDDDIEAFKRRFPLGTMQHLALMLLLHTVVRRSDVVLLGQKSMQRGALAFKESKGRAATRKEAVIDISPALRAAIDAVPGAWQRPTFLVNQHSGKPFTGSTFSSWFAVWCDEVFGMPGTKAPIVLAKDGKRQRSRGRRPTWDGLPARSAHGVRKHMLVRGAEAGKSERELAAMLGHTTTKHVGKYAKKASRSRLFANAMDGLL